MHPVPSFLGDRFEYWAETTPDREALAYGERRWTWAQWRDRVHRAAGALVAAGVGRGDRVAFLDKNHPACLDTTLAAASIGAAHAIVNWRLAEGELEYVINDSGARVLFVGAEFLPQLAPIRDRLSTVERVVTVGAVGGDTDEYEAWLAGGEPTGRRPDVTVDDVCLVMYSSGTTGKPKGVMLTHHNLIAHWLNVIQAFPLEETDRNLVAMPLFHVGGTSHALNGIHPGVATTLTREPDAPSLFAALAGGVTHAFVVPAIVAGVLAAGDAAIQAFSRFKLLGYGAAPMPLPLLRRALAAWPDTDFVQVYGMTELAGVISALRPEAHRDEAHPERLVSAGTLVPGAKLRVVDPATLEDAEPGRPGELWFQSEQVMAGYLGKPEATAEAVTEDGWLRSGDIGRVDADGFIYIEDRLKDMIITGGENVYSPEVESALAAHPAVADAAVIGVPDEHWGESVKAFVVAVPGQAVEPDELIAFCRDRLAHYKCPTTVEVVAELPRNPTGKVLKRTLREPYWQGRDRVI